ncbi:MAG: hypothetical protein QM655_07165 [Nocardioidaceae bacterium]
MAEFDAAWIQRNRWMAAVLLPWLLILAVVAIVNPSVDVLWPAVLVGVAATLGIRTIHALIRASHVLPPPDGRPLIARSRAVSPTDYLPRSRQIALWCLLVLPLGVGILVVHALQAGEIGSAGGIALLASEAAATLSVLLVALVPYALCRRPEAAVDACHLYAQDAWRSDALVECQEQAFFAVLQVALASQALSDSLAVVSAPSLVLFGIAVLLGSRKRAKLWFRKRLWPMLPPDHVLMPGEELHDLEPAA